MQTLIPAIIFILLVLPKELWSLLRRATPSEMDPLEVQADRYESFLEPGVVRETQTGGNWYVGMDKDYKYAIGFAEAGPDGEYYLCPFLAVKPGSNGEMRRVKINRLGHHAHYIEEVKPEHMLNQQFFRPIKKSYVRAAHFIHSNTLSPNSASRHASTSHVDSNFPSANTSPSRGNQNSANVSRIFSRTDSSDAFPFPPVDPR